jgi:hypothetical protein
LFTEKGEGSTGTKLTVNFFLNGVQSVFIFTLYYQVFILGPIDMAKVYLLRNNQKVIGIFYCIICGFTMCVEALALEELVDEYVSTNRTLTSKVQLYV